MKESICWTCKNAYPLKCSWIGTKKRIWNKARKEKRYSQLKDRAFYIYAVEQCERYEPETKRKRCVY